MRRFLLWLLGHPVIEELAQIRADLERSEADKVLLQDRIERAEQEKVWHREQFERLDREKTLAYKMVINLDAQREGRPAPFPEAPKLPSTMVRAPQRTDIPAARAQGSQLVNELTAKFVDHAKQKYGVKEA